MVSPLSIKELRVVKNKAREFIKSRQIEKALIIYARILKLFPDDLESLLMLGDACLVRRDRERAIKFYTRAYELASWRDDIIRRLEIANEPIRFKNPEVIQPLDILNPSTQQIVVDDVDVTSGIEQDETIPLDIIERSFESNENQPEENSENSKVENLESDSLIERIIPDTIIDESHQIIKTIPEKELLPEYGTDEVVAEQKPETKPGLGDKAFADLINNVSKDISSSRASEPVSMQEIRKKIPIEKLRQKISDDQVQSANDLMDSILQSQSPSKVVADHLEDLDDLLPALIEMNIRQSRTQGRPDLAEALEEILSDVLFNVEGFEEEELLSITKPVNINLDSAPTIIVDGVNSKESPFRLYHLQSALAEAGYNIIAWNNQEEASRELHSADFVLLHNPHCQQKFIKMLAERAGINKPTIVDLDLDFRTMPIYHPDYLTMGMNSSDQFRAYTTVLQLADLITVGSSFSTKLFIEEGFNAIYMPEMWNSDNELWSKQSNDRDTLNIGVMAITGQLADIAEVRRGIVRVIREFPQTRLVVTGDADAYRLFDNLPEGKRIFYPDVEPDDYPYMLSQMDIILSPYENNTANNHHSDRILMEAGIKKIPWLASPIQSYQSWNAGGILAESIEDWYFGLKKLILDPQARLRLGEAGFNKTRDREIKTISSQWEHNLKQILEVV
jgi:tetratricopeptide (TPR) repeat protein